ncbi:MAG: hypothetical protein ACI8PD_002265 [Nitrospinales bacterium]|jgi:hypothetical protein
MHTKTSGFLFLRVTKDEFWGISGGDIFEMSGLIRWFVEKPVKPLLIENRPFL